MYKICIKKCPLYSNKSIQLCSLKTPVCCQNLSLVLSHSRSSSLSTWNCLRVFANKPAASDRQSRDRQSHPARLIEYQRTASSTRIKTWLKLVQAVACGLKRSTSCAGGINARLSDNA